MLAILRQEKLELADMLRTTAEYVNTTAAGDEAKLLSSGFVITKTPEKHHLPGSIEKIAAKFTNLPQSIELQWSRSKNASYYQVYISADSGITWTLQSSVFGRKLMLNALVSGTRYQLKVIPVNKAGKGEASDVASQIAA
ncbi:MAG: fibronectin type III domain-containing protein [Bacteroidetes bacterium]|nr:fibronectin type III domain-containing protein [Bacteroidota bacterium]